jgi:hypothetical protein
MSPFQVASDPGASQKYLIYETTSSFSRRSAIKSAILDLSTERTSSSMFRDATGRHWKFPSPHQFYNPLVWDTPEGDIEAVLQGWEVGGSS